MGGGGVFWHGPDKGSIPARSDWGDVPSPGPDGGYPSQVWPGGTQARSRWRVPQSGLMGGIPGRSDRGYTRWGTPSRDGVPSPSRDGVPPGTEQQIEYLIIGGRYASCIHAGGLSRLTKIYIVQLNVTDVFKIFTLQILSSCVNISPRCLFAVVGL